ncbi:MAG: MOSC domain-containing protein [Caldilineales bacterium]
MPGVLSNIVFTPLPGSFNRKPLVEATLIAGYGITDDRKGGHPKRNLNIMDEEMLAMLASEGYPAQPGVLGENLVVQGINVSALPAGSHLRIGDSALIEVGKLREPCYKLTALDARMPDTVIGRVGVMARVLHGGIIRVGDSVYTS